MMKHFLFLISQPTHPKISSITWHPPQPDVAKQRLATGMGDEVFVVSLHGQQERSGAAVVRLVSHEQHLSSLVVSSVALCENPKADLLECPK